MTGTAIPGTIEAMATVEERIKTAIRFATIEKRVSALRAGERIMVTRTTSGWAIGGVPVTLDVNEFCACCGMESIPSNGSGCLCVSNECDDERHELMLRAVDVRLG